MNYTFIYNKFCRFLFHMNEHFGSPKIMEKEKTV